MALQTSGAISLNQIHVEAGGSSGTIASINDADIRGLISKGSGATMSFNEWYGASSSIDSQTMYVGSFAPFAYYTGTWYGAISTSTTSTATTSFDYGSLSSGYCAFRSGNPYRNFYFRSQAGNGTASGFLLAIQGHGTNTGWTTLDANNLAGSSTIYRTNCTYINQSNGWSYWQQSNIQYLNNAHVGAIINWVFN
jgi:hypothetical protein